MPALVHEALILTIIGIVALGLAVVFLVRGAMEIGIALLIAGVVILLI